MPKWREIAIIKSSQHISLIPPGLDSSRRTRRALLLKCRMFEMIVEFHDRSVQTVGISEKWDYAPNSAHLGPSPEHVLWLSCSLNDWGFVIVIGIILFPFTRARSQVLLSLLVNRKKICRGSEDFAHILDPPVLHFGVCKVCSNQRLLL